MRRLLSVVLAAALAACASVEATDPTGDVRPLEDGSAEALGVLALLNAPATTFAVLDDEVGLDRRAAANLIERRDGPDGVSSTADDRPFHSIAEVDEVAWVGDAAIAALLDYARAQGWVPAGDDLLGTFDGVPFTVDEAIAALDLVNTAPEASLRGDVGLDGRAVQSILAARPIATMDQLASLYYVGSAMLQRIKSFVSATEIGVVSDLDKTVIPDYEGELPAAAYPGVATLYTALEGPRTGDVYYVTARPEWMVEGIPEWLAAHGVPSGPIDTGVSPIPYQARAEKVADISAVFDAHPDQQFLLFGDTNHVDPDVFRDVIDRYGDRVVAAFVHDVKEIEPERLEGLILFQDYGQVATALSELGLLDEAIAQQIVAEATP